MFNFFEEIKQGLRHTKGAVFDNYTIINLSGKLLYIEGLKSLLTLSHEMIAFRAKNSVFYVEGTNLSVEELSENTLKISGNIKKVEEA